MLEHGPKPEVQIEHNPVQELELLLTDNNYQEGVAKVQSKLESNKLSQIEKQPETEAKKQITSLIENIVFEQLKKDGTIDSDAVLDIDFKKKLGKDWGMALGKFKKQGGEVSYQDQIFNIAQGGNCPELQSILLAQAKTNEEYMAELTEARQEVEAAVSKAKQMLQKMHTELQERKDDPELLNALSVWGSSPNSQLRKGIDGKGFNAGVVHYFEYRDDVGKEGRYNDETTEFGIDGFIEYSKKYGELLENPSASNENIQKFVRFTDDKGNQRLVILTADKPEPDLVIAFQHEGEPLKVISAVADKEKKLIKQFDKAVKKELSQDPKEDTRLNRLGNGRKIIDANE